MTITPEARLTRSLELIYTVDDLEHLQDIKDAVEYRRVYLQQLREEELGEEQTISDS